MQGIINVQTPSPSPSPSPSPTVSTISPQHNHTHKEISYSFADGRITMRDESGKAINAPVKLSFNIDLNISF